MSGMYFNNNRLANDPVSSFLNTVEFITYGNQINREPFNSDEVNTRDFRFVYPLLRGVSSPGSQLLRGGSWER